MRSSIGPSCGGLTCSLAPFTPLSTIQETRSDNPCAKSALSTLAWIRSAAVGVASAGAPTDAFAFSCDNPAAASLAPPVNAARSNPPCAGFAASATVGASVAFGAVRGPAAAPIPERPSGADAAEAIASAPAPSAAMDAFESYELSPLGFPVFASRGVPATAAAAAAVIAAASWAPVPMTAGAAAWIEVSPDEVDAVAGVELAV